MTPEEKFQAALKVVLKHEGGYVNIREDRGGPTNFGITQHDLAKHRGHEVTADDVKAMKVAEAAEIYRKKYWLPYRFDRIRDFGISLLLFDQGVLNGPSRAIKIVQKALGLEQDGKIGPKTLAAINQSNCKELLKDCLALLELRYRTIVANNPSQKIFLKGWLNRLKRLSKTIEEFL
ncbi:MAG TPA: glycosyl hydrolase 108 family protein [Blastocatellia bacterium]|nr:glycosyl hydrolase 108 family protein [Blastocatellia bacterium]